MARSQRSDNVQPLDVERKIQPERWRWHEAMLADRSINFAAKTVGAAILQFINSKSGNAFQSQQELALAAGTTDRTVRTALRDLVQAGYLTKTRGGGGFFRSGQGRTAIYRLQLSGVILPDNEGETGGEPGSYVPPIPEAGFRGESRKEASDKPLKPLNVTTDKGDHTVEDTPTQSTPTTALPPGEAAMEPMEPMELPVAARKEATPMPDGTLGSANLADAQRVIGAEIARLMGDSPGGGRKTFEALPQSTKTALRTACARGRLPVEDVRAALVSAGIKLPEG